MVHITFEIPEGVLGGLGSDAVDFASEIRLAAAVDLYELRRVSQGRAAEIAGLSRADFIQALGRFGVSAFQTDADDALIETPDAGDRVPRIYSPRLVNKAEAAEFRKEVKQIDPTKSV